MWIHIDYVCYLNSEYIIERKKAVYVFERDKLKIYKKLNFDIFNENVKNYYFYKDCIIFLSELHLLGFCTTYLIIV